MDEHGVYTVRINANSVKHEQVFKWKEFMITEKYYLDEERSQRAAQAPQVLLGVKAAGRSQQLP